MRELTIEEVQVVNGGRISWGDGASAVLALSMYSPVTMAFGLPIAGAMYTMAVFTDN